jgi:hypothetical protein
MKVNVKFNGVPILYKTLNKKKEIQIEFPGTTLREFVDYLVWKFGTPIKKALLDNSNDIDMEIRVVLNNETFLSEGRMDTSLRDGDTLAFMGAS